MELRSRNTQMLLFTPKPLVEIMCPYQSKLEVSAPALNLDGRLWWTRERAQARLAALWRSFLCRAVRKPREGAGRVGAAALGPELGGPWVGQSGKRGPPTRAVKDPHTLTPPADRLSWEREACLPLEATRVFIVSKSRKSRLKCWYLTFQLLWNFFSCPLLRILCSWFAFGACVPLQGDHR